LLPGYEAIELCKVSFDTQEELKKLMNKKKIPMILLMDEQKTIITEKLKTLQCVKLSENLFISAIMRAMIDLRAYGIVPNEAITFCFEEINRKYNTCDDN